MDVFFFYAQETFIWILGKNMTWIVSWVMVKVRVEADPSPWTWFSPGGHGPFVTSSLYFTKHLVQKNKRLFSPRVLVPDLHRVMFVRCIWTRLQQVGARWSMRMAGWRCIPSTVTQQHPETKLLFIYLFLFLQIFCQYAECGPSVDFQVSPLFLCCFH